MQKNPFKKKRGEGYIPPSQQKQEDNDVVQPSLATYSLMHQAVKNEEPKNDAVIPGTFGGDGPLKDMHEQR